MTDAIRQAIADLECIVNREDYTFAECSEAEEIVVRAKSALASLRAIGDIDRVRAEAMREAEQDAKRYQWLVENANINTATWAHYGLDPASTKQPLDNAIDAAIAQQEQEGTK